MNRRMLLSVLGALASLATVTIPAHAVDVDISAGPTGNGCTVCYNGPSQLHVDEVVTLDNEGTGPDQITLDAGTYRITNAALTGNYSAWRFNGGDNWAWSFIYGSDNGNGTATVINAGWVYGISSSQAGMAADSNDTVADLYGVLDAHGSVAGFTDTFTLTSRTTLDFFVDDGYLGDNVGGVGLRIEPVGNAAAVPEPASWAMMVGGFGLAGSAMRNRRKFATRLA